MKSISFNTSITLEFSEHEPTETLYEYDSRFLSKRFGFVIVRNKSILFRFEIDTLFPTIMVILFNYGISLSLWDRSLYEHLDDGWE